MKSEIENRLCRFKKKNGYHDFDNNCHCIQIMFSYCQEYCKYNQVLKKTCEILKIRK